MSKYAKYIFTDLQNATSFLKCAVMNSFACCKRKEGVDFKLDNVPYSIVAWAIEELTASPEWECKAIYTIEYHVIPELLYKGQPVEVKYSLMDSTLTIKFGGSNNETN